MLNQIHDIPLDQIRPAPWNPPSRLDPAKVRELADNIKQEGQRSAALVRPVEAEAPVRYELVFGHRRYAAKWLLGDTQGKEFKFLRAEIEEMDEERAMIISGIENLQREDPSDIEEAEFFQACSERYGDSAVKILSEKLSISPRYIRKRIELLKLPERALELWRSGTWHVGHVELLLRLGDEVEAFLDKFDERRLPDLEVHELRDLVGRQAIKLHIGNFDKADCKTCQKNTDCQHKLFDFAKEKGALCLDQKCFTAKQQAWYDLNWATCKENRHGTQAAVIGDYETKVTGSFSGYDHQAKPGKKCRSCPHFATIISINGHQIYSRHDKVCMGEAACFAAIAKADKQEKKKEKVESDAPRVAWHGEYYRQEYYQQQIPLLVNELDPEDLRRLQLALALLVHQVQPIHLWFTQLMDHPVDISPDRESWFRLSFPRILELTKDLTLKSSCESAIAEVSVRIALINGYGSVLTDQARQALATLLDIDWCDFQVTEAYLKKKTKAEIIKFIGCELGLLQEPAFIAYLQAKGMPTGLEKLAMYKKGALMDLVLNCGIDLRGRLPKEIADRPEL
ncbi:MAG: ParB/RepB/Spo0J family partition protein [Candidatus Paceibacterota bacterium]|jgi:ParB/RepB/Spo0J family partition protein